MLLRKFIKKIYNKLLYLLHKPLVKDSSTDSTHQIFLEFIKIASKANAPRILEIGSRNVTGVTRKQQFLNAKEYTGFDYLPGEGVDVVGDAHNLSQFLPANHFDLVYSISVFEHLLFPWKVVLEINNVMKIGGYLFISTHPVWPPHELPWDFWRFPLGSFDALFNKYTGFEIVKRADGLPCRTYSLVNDVPTKNIYRDSMALGVAVIAKKTHNYRKDLLNWEINAADVINTAYPPP